MHESLTLDVKQPDAVNIVLQLLAQADVLVRNLPPGAMQRP
ncbi:CoA transferase [Paraburkholderia sp. HC6.4b]